MRFLIWLQSWLKTARMQQVQDEHCIERASRSNVFSTSLQERRPTKVPSFSAITKKSSTEQVRRTFPPRHAGDPIESSAVDFQQIGGIGAERRSSSLRFLLPWNTQCMP
jgi:hypothetical protein